LTRIIIDMCYSDSVSSHPENTRIFAKFGHYSQAIPQWGLNYNGRSTRNRELSGPCETEGCSEDAVPSDMSNYI